MQVSTIMLTAALTMFGTQNMSQSADATQTTMSCRVVAIHDSDVPADLPAQQGGTLKDIAVKVGDYVKKGDILATVDNELERLSLEVSKQRLEMAREEAENDVNVRYAKKASSVANFKAQTVMEAVDDVKHTFSRSEVMTYLLTAEQFALQTEQAEHEQKLAKMSVNVRQAEYELAQYELARREIRAPVDGVVEDVKRVVGDWVRAGEPIVRLIQLDRLKIEATLDYGERTPADIRGREVIVTIHDLAPSLLASDKPTEADLKQGQFLGVVNQIGSDFGRGQIRIIVEVINRKDANGDWLLMPGMKGEMRMR